MIRRKLNTEKCGCCCTLKEKLQYLWEHTMGAIKKVNDITPDGDGKFTVEAGQNVLLTPISNGMKISTTGGISYYSAGDTYVDVDNNDLEISLNNPGQTGGVALHDDLEVVATGLTNLLAGGNVGSDTKPIKIVNGVATPVDKDLFVNEIGGFHQATNNTGISGTVYWLRYGKLVYVAILGLSGFSANTNDQIAASGLPASITNAYTVVSNSSGNITALCYIDTSGNLRMNVGSNPSSYYTNFFYLSNA